MKVIEGGFGHKAEEVGQPIIQMITEALEKLELLESSDADFFLIVAGKKGAQIVSNQDLGEILVLMEIVKAASVSHLFEEFDD